MAFVSKMTKQSTKAAKPDYTVSQNQGRLCLIFRNGIVPPGTLVEVYVGTDEDKGLLKVQYGEGEAVSTLGKKGNVTVWSATRAAAKKNMPFLKRVAAELVESGEDFDIIKY